jgi:hypothetical protein
LLTDIDDAAALGSPLLRVFVGPEERREGGVGEPETVRRRRRAHGRQLGRLIAPVDLAVLDAIDAHARRQRRQVGQAQRAGPQLAVELGRAHQDRIATRHARRPLPDHLATPRTRHGLARVRLVPCPERR